MKDLQDCYVMHQGKRLQCGYTTGSCAAAAAKAATYMLLGQKKIEEVELEVPAKVLLKLKVHDCQVSQDGASCAIQKYAGDDPDVTDGILVYAKVSYSKQPGIHIDAGKGVGRVTKEGLEQAVGQAAINKVPRIMISRGVEEVLDEYCCEQGIDVMIEIPKGEELAQKTFNPRLGIQGGISVLGTKGIVVPMSEEALLSSIEVEVDQRLLEGDGYLLMTPGNYGEDFLRNEIGLDISHNIRCSNFIGKTLDMAVNKKAKGVLFTGHIGKLVKVGAGIMDTHSRNADARGEELASCLILAGGSAKVAREILLAPTTDAMLQILNREDMLSPVMEILIERIYQALMRRTFQEMEIGILLFSNEFGLLAEKNTKNLREHFEKRGLCSED